MQSALIYELKVMHTLLLQYFDGKTSNNRISTALQKSEYNQCSYKLDLLYFIIQDLQITLQIPWTK